MLALHHVPLEFDSAAIREVLSDLTVENLRIMWASRDFKVTSSAHPTEQETL